MSFLGFVPGGAVEPCVGSACSQQLWTGSLSGNSPTFEQYHTTEMMRSGEAVRDDESRAAAHEFGNGLHDRLFGGWIQCGGWLIQQQNRGILQECPRDANTLSLA